MAHDYPKDLIKSIERVHQNSILGFLGPNGAGKTTTIKHLDRGCNLESILFILIGLYRFNREEF